MSVVEFRRPKRAFSWMEGPSFFIITGAASLALFMVIFFANHSDKTNADAATGSRDSLSGSFASCNGSSRFTCVIDGDTFWFRGQKIRIADINTPELGGAQCAHERALAQRAKDRLARLLSSGNFSLMAIDRDRDRYGRLLRIVERDGDSLGDILVDEGLAERWGGYRRSWC